MQHNEAERAEMLMRQRMARASMQQQQQMHPQMQQQMQMQQQQRGAAHTPPSMKTSPVMPAPAGALKAPPGMTGNTMIPRGSDPVGHYKNLKKEAATGSGTAEAKGDIMLGVNKLIVGVISALAFSAIFVLPRQLQVFWVLVVGLTVLLAIGLQLYKELMEMSKGGGENAKYAEWAWVLLFSLVMLFTGVMVGILFFMAWSLYTIANSKTNIARNGASEQDEQEVQERGSSRREKRKHRESRRASEYAYV